MKELQRHRIVYKCVRILLRPFLFLRFSYRFRQAGPLPSPVLVLANHCTDWDPFFLSQSFPDHMYFVASEHIFRWSGLGRLIAYLGAPIPRAKATNDTATVKRILRCLNSGSNVCIFPEGGRSFNGETNNIAPSIGKLVKQGHSHLVTFRLRGGYFTQPHWSRTLRRGPTFGEPVAVYSKEVLQSMTEDEINAQIQKDLYCNAYEEQAKLRGVYRGRRLAEHLETILYLCPNCASFSTLVSKNDTLRCSCGLSLRYNSFGFLEASGSSSLPFSTIIDWDNWQLSCLEENLSSYQEANPKYPIIFDDDQSLFEVAKGASSIPVGCGTFALYSDRFEFLPLEGAPHSFPIDKISAMAIQGNMNLVFFTDTGGYYELRSDKPRSATKYIELYKLLRKEACLRKGRM